MSMALLSQLSRRFSWVPIGSDIRQVLSISRKEGWLHRTAMSFRWLATKLITLRKALGFKGIGAKSLKSVDNRGLAGLPKRTLTALVSKLQRLAMLF